MTADMTLYTVLIFLQNTNVQITQIPKTLCVTSHTSELVRPNVLAHMFRTLGISKRVIEKKKKHY